MSSCWNSRLWCNISALINQKNAIEFLKKYSDLLNSITILALNICVLVGKMFFSSYIASASLVLMHFTGLLSLTYQFTLLKTTIKNGRFSFYMHSWNNLINISIKVMSIFGGILLTISSSVAFLLKFSHNYYVTNCIYQLMRSFGTVLQIVNMYQNVYDNFMSKRIISCAQLKNSDIQKSISYAYKPLRFKQVEISPETRTLAASIRNCMDKDTWKVFSRNLNTNNYNKLFFCTVIENIKTQYFDNQANIVLKFLGHISMFIIRIYPNPETFIHIITNIAISALYTINLCMTKFKQRCQQIETVKPL